MPESSVVKPLTPDEQYAKDMEEICGTLAEKLVDSGLVNRHITRMHKDQIRVVNIRDTKGIIWKCFSEFFKAKSLTVN